MGIAVPSLAEASRRLPSSVKADPASADDVLVTSVAIAPPAIDEPVSPELALVDPELRERLRALLPEIELELPPPLLRALPDPETEEALPLTPPPELVAEAAAVPSSAPLEVPVYVFPTRGDRFRSFAKAFALGAAAATVVTVGVVSELGEGPAIPQEPTPTPPRVAAPTPKPKAAAPTTGRNGTGGAAARENAVAAGRAKAKHRSANAGGSTKKAARTKRQEPPAPATPTKVEPKRFAWAPVAGAVGYRFELFRGDKQVLEVQTKAPAYELGSHWRHAGRTETLTTGDYRWYVWPVLASGPAKTAVVQARLTVP
jgi:hypothetical protein